MHWTCTKKMLSATHWYLLEIDNRQTYKRLILRTYLFASAEKWFQVRLFQTALHFRIKQIKNFVFNKLEHMLSTSRKIVFCERLVIWKISCQNIISQPFKKRKAQKMSSAG